MLKQISKYARPWKCARLWKCATVAGFAIAMFAACSDDPSVAGTAVEPNQNPIAYEESSFSVDESSSSATESAASSSAEKTSASSSSIKSAASSSANDDASSSSAKGSAASSSSKKFSSSSETIKSSSSEGKPASSSSKIEVRSSSSENPIQPFGPETFSSEIPDSSSDGTDGNDSGVKPPQANLNYFVDFLSYYKTTATFDEHVLAYRLLNISSCENGEQCSEAPAIYEEFRHARFYKNIDSEIIDILFPATTSAISKYNVKLKCPFHLLNIETYSTTGFVLTEITNDKLTVADAVVSTACEVNTKEKVFGILILSCEEFSDSIKIEHQKAQNIGEELPCVTDFNLEWTRNTILKKERDYE